MRTLISRFRVIRARRDEDGLGLIELMIALMVLSIAVLALASVASASLIQLRNSRARQEASDAASALIEDLRIRSYSAIALDAADTDVIALGGCDPTYAEPLVTTNISADAIPHVQAYGPSGRITVTTFVSWYDEGDDQACNDAGHDRTTKRVTAVATWFDAGAERRVEQSTLISEVDRGLPAPSFRLGTPTATVAFYPEDISDEKEACVGHVLRNLGAQDTYEWHVERLGGGSTVKANRTEYRTADGKWTIRAFFETPASDVAVSPATYGIPLGTQVSNPTGLPSDVELMYDAIGDGNTRPEETAVVDTGTNSRIWICYTPDDSVAQGTQVDFKVTVNSRFDENLTQVVLHTLQAATSGSSSTTGSTTGSTGSTTTPPTTTYRMFLFDPDTTPNGASHDRVVSNSGAVDTYTMGPTGASQPEILGTASPVPDMDRNVDPDDLPGIVLRDFVYKTNGATTSETRFVTFNEQFTTARTLQRNASLVVYVAPTSALKGSTASTPVTFSVRVRVLGSNEQTVVATPVATFNVTYTHSTAGYQAITVPIDFGANLSIAANRYLSLTIGCNNSADPCHLGYDHTSLPSAFTVEVLS